MIAASRQPLIKSNLKINGCRSMMIIARKKTTSPQWASYIFWTIPQSLNQVLSSYLRKVIHAFQWSLSWFKTKLQALDQRFITPFQATKITVYRGNSVEG
ncbi:hypothetical protein BGP75_22220 [Motiliproteus sp. MSK22-1]|nr:hypothetical protein BGP75_22220 [Motiliproteus sp. MSK22-1]